ncbi:MAG: response regulator transcription factor [Rhizobiaceae bacterium]
MQRILIVDDHPTVADTLQHWLKTQDEGIEPTVVNSMVEALKLLMAEPSFDLILLDYDMQPTNGLEGMKAILKTHPDQKIAFLSGITEPDILQNALNMGAMGWMPKAMESQALLQAIRLILAGERFVPISQMEDIAALNENPLLAKLTNKERAVAQLLADGDGDKEIALRLDMEPKTASNHVRTILKKTGYENRVKFAIAFQNKS